MRLTLSLKKPSKIPLVGLQNRRWSGCKENDFDFWYMEARTLFKTEAFISLFSKLKQLRLNLTALQKKEVREDEMWTKKNGGVSWGTPGPEGICCHVSMQVYLQHSIIIGNLDNNDLYQIRSMRFQCWNRLCFVSNWPPEHEKEPLIDSDWQ